LLVCYHTLAQRLVERIGAAESAIAAVPTVRALEEYETTLTNLQEKMKALIRANEQSAAARVDVAFKQSIDTAKFAVTQVSEKLSLSGCAMCEK